MPVAPPEVPFNRGVKALGIPVAEGQFRESRFDPSSNHAEVSDRMRPWTKRTTVAMTVGILLSLLTLLTALAVSPQESPPALSMRFLGTDSDWLAGRGARFIVSNHTDALMIHVGGHFEEADSRQNKSRIPAGSRPTIEANGSIVFHARRPIPPGRWVLVVYRSGNADSRKVAWYRQAIHLLGKAPLQRGIKESLGIHLAERLDIGHLERSAPFDVAAPANP